MLFQGGFTRGWHSGRHGAAATASPLGLRSITVVDGLERAPLDASAAGADAGVLPVRIVRIHADSPDGGPVSKGTGPSPFARKAGRPITYLRRRRLKPPQAVDPVQVPVVTAHARHAAALRDRSM